MMPRCAWVVSCLLPACVQLGGDGAGESGGAGPHAVLVGTIETNPACDRVGAVEVVLRATRVGCEDPGPCTLPSDPEPIDGDRYTCPATDPTALLGVEVGEGGRYAVEAVVVSTTADPLDRQCYATPGGAPPVLVTTADVDAGAHIMLDPTGSPCP